MKEEKMYKACVKDSKGKINVIEGLYTTKSAFIKDLRANGYKVNYYKVKEIDVYEYIINETNATPDDWKNINEVPEDKIYYKN